MEKVNTRLAVAALVLLLGVLLAGKAAGAEEAAASPPQPQLGSTKADCEVSGTCDMKLLGAAADPTRPGAVANKYTRGCSAINQCRD